MTLRIAAVSLLLLAGPAAAQSSCFTGSVDEDVRCRFAAPRWVGEFASLSANGLIGALTAGVVQHLRGGSFTAAFTRGAAGGVMSWAGKRIAAERFAAAGLVGRGMSAAGASVVRNVSLGEQAFSRLTLPVGPVWLEVRPDGARRVAARLDPVALGWLVYGIAEPELDLDVSESLSAGAPVFRTDGKLLARGGDDVHAAGTTSAGVIFLADIPAYGESFERRSLAHERVHVLQEDALAIQWTDPLALHATRSVPGMSWLGRHLAVNVSTELLRLFGRAIPDHEERPWELESIFFAR